jgi:hypothetical protein
MDAVVAVTVAVGRSPLSVGFSATTPLPPSPYSGRAVAISTDSYRSYFSNGTTPASASWVAVLNSSGTFGSDVKLAVGKKLILGSDVNLYRDSANVLATDDSPAVTSNLTVSGSGSVTGNLAVTGHPTLAAGVACHPPGQPRDICIEEVWHGTE